MSNIIQLNPSLPVTVIGKGKGKGQAIILIDYGKEDHLIWVVALDSNGEIWAVPNPSVRLQENYSLGRNLKK